MKFLNKKRENYEKKNMGNYRLIFPNSDPCWQEKYLEYLKTSAWSVPYQISKSNKNNQDSDALKSNSFKDNLRKKQGSITTSENKINKWGSFKSKNPYSADAKKFITPVSQKQKKRANISNPNWL